MSSWKQEYLAALKGVEKDNPVNMDLVQTCTQLANRLSTLEAQLALQQTTITPSSQSPNPSAPQPSSPALNPAQLTLDLAESLRSNQNLETRLRAAEAELERLRARTKTDARSIRELGNERNALAVKLRDRDHELREKKRLIETVQDELVALELQLSMAEQQRDKVKVENEELVARWMRRKAKEADAMNRANEPFMDKHR